MKNLEYMNVMIEKETKKEVRLLAAEMETSISQAAQRLVSLGLAAYKAQKPRPTYRDPNPRPSMDGTTLAEEALKND
ncbi:MAG: hypothetical protein LBJ31_04370 [Treponema sp.]|nr:hypothetical protein [Treponema sp.]